MKKILNVLTLLVFISINTIAQKPAATIPEFNFFKLDNTSFINKNLEKGKLLFFVFFDTECDHCQHAIKNMNEHYTAFNNTAVYLITQDVKSKIEAFMNKYGKNLRGRKNITILQDLKLEFIQKFRPKKYPSMFLYSADKNLILYDDNEQNLPDFLKKIKGK